METQASWLEAARGTLFRQVHIARRRLVLEIGCGSGAITPELVRRCGGLVVALDRDVVSLKADTVAFIGAQRVCADASQLPFKEGTFELAFIQCTFIWIHDLASTIREVARVLCQDGALVALEPDYGGMMEYPSQIATRDIWVAALTRAGANPIVGRELPGILEASGLSVRTNFLSGLHPPAPERFQLLRNLPLTEEELTKLELIEAQDRALGIGWKRVVHLPFFLITAVKRG